MAHSYSLTDGSTTISLTSGAIAITTDFTPSSPDMDIRELPTDDDGGEVDSLRYKNATDTIEIMILGASGAAVQTNARSIETLLESARRRQQRRAGPRVYFQVQLDSDTSVWRAEILSAKFELGDKALNVWGNFKLEARIHITRPFYWEGPETELQLSTGATAATTGGVTIYNHDDATSGHDNWVQIANTQVGGVLPTPVKLVLTNNTGSGLNTRNFYLATNAFSDPANFIHVLEGEARTSSTTVVDATSSGGNYTSITFTTSSFMDWALTAAQMQRTQGRRFQLLTRILSWTGTAIYVKPSLYDSTNTLLMKDGDEVLLTGISGSAILDLGSLPLPNGGYQVAWPAMTLRLSLRATGAATITLDFIQLTPLDAYQQIIQRGFTVANGSSITIDNIEGLTYQSAGGPIFTPLSGPLKVFPGVTQKIIILHDEGSGGSNISRTFSVRAYIRERRLTV